MSSTTREAPKRTRRVAQPFDDRLEVRCYKAEKGHLAAQAKERGMSVGDLVRFQLGDLLGPGPAQVAETPDPQPAAASEPPTDLAAIIAQALDCSYGHALLKIKMGKVTAAGEVWTDQMIPGDRLDQLVVDGELLVQSPDGQ